GDGIAIAPETNEVYAPFDGEVKVVFPTKHAIGLRSNDGIELMIHVGLDTVELDGEFFETFVQEGDQVRKGDKLISFDREQIAAKGYDTITPIIITNSDLFKEIKFANNGELQSGETLIEVQ